MSRKQEKKKVLRRRLSKGEQANLDFTGAEPRLRLLTDIELEKLGIGTARTRQNLRSQGQDPLPHIRVGRLVRYRLEDVLAYLEQNRVSQGR